LSIKNKILNHVLLRDVNRMVVVEISREMSAPLDKGSDVISESVKKRFTEATFENPRMIMAVARMVIDEKRRH
jgi:hypothetical protein